MEKLFSADLSNQIRNLLLNMKKPVSLILFLEGNCPTCPETAELLKETAELSEKLTLTVYERLEHPDLVQKYDIQRVPSFVLLDDLGVYRGVKFSGIPAGHEINSFLSAILEMSGWEAGVDSAMRNRLSAIDKPVNIKVFVSLSCPHCPGAVQTAHRLAMRNGHIKSEMIETQTFPALSEQYKVTGVPKIVINDSVELLGDQPVEAFITALERL